MNEKATREMNIQEFIDEAEDDIHARNDLYRHIPEPIPSASWYIIVTEFCERFAYYGGSTPFQNYIQNGPTGNPPGALNKGQAVATGLQSFFTFFCYLTPMLGAIMADQYVGRFKTILIFSLIYMAGWLILTCTALPSSQEAGASFPGFIVSLIIIGIGTGGIKGIVSAFCAGQYKFSENHTKTLNTGETVIVDYDLSIQHMYNWFYWAINLGALLGGSICPFLEFSVGFYAAFLLPTCMFAVAILVFISGYKKYSKHKPTSSIIIISWRVISFAYRQSRIPENKTAREHSNSFIDFAKRDSHIPDVKEWSTSISAQVTWDDEFVDELKQTMMACKIFFPLSIYWVCYNQLSNNLLSQAGIMNRPPGLPNDVMNNFDPIALIIFIPIVDLVFYPTLRKYNINFAPQKRITVGFMLAASSMAYAAIIQHFIYVDPQFISSGKANISVFWQVPCYLLLAFSEIFASITPMEYAYTHSPKSMKSFVSALSLWPTCISALISMAISPSAHDPNMVYVYGGVAVAAFICGCLYYLVFGHYDKLDEANKEKKYIREHKYIDVNVTHKETAELQTFEEEKLEQKISS